MRCFFCKSDKTIRCGTRRTRNRGIIQRYLCKHCKRRFTHDDGFRNRHKAPDMILDVVLLWLKGLSLRQLADQFQVSKNSCFAWVISYLHHVIQFWGDVKPSISVKLHLDELFLHMQNTFYYIWDSISAENRFCTLHLEPRRGSAEAEELIVDSPRPLKIVADGAFPYMTPVRKCFGTQWFHENFHQCVDFEDKKNNNIIERLQGTLRRYFHPRRGFHRLETGKELIQLYELYLNFVRKHMALGKTPAEAAGLVRYPEWIETEKQRLGHLLREATYFLLLFISRELGQNLRRHN
ncbi:MAG: DDE-type integrase/transposase/recombinase [Candidatus Micrarchaeota archaeon]